MMLLRTDASAGAHRTRTVRKHTFIFASATFVMKVEVVKVGDHRAFVVPAYLLVFGIWSVASSYDYISGKWRPVATARCRGMRHLCVLLFPMVYMIVYIRFQADVKDFKEMSSALLALIFACADFARTVLGLWQLHVFRHWVVAGIKSLESLGGPVKRGINTERRNLFRIADSLMINDLIVNNRLTEGEIECFLRVTKSPPKMAWKAKFRELGRWISCIWYFPRLRVAICRSRIANCSSPSSAIYLDPYDAEDIWMRWACILVAQVFPQWLDDMQKSDMSDMSSEDGLSEQLSRFQRRLLCSAALHVRNRIDEVSDAETMRAAEHSCFELGIWHKYPKLCNGAFSLQEFLSVACETGAGLPFGVPHKKARAGGKHLEYSYSKFKSKLRRIRVISPVDDVAKLERFETCHLEWLAVFLSVPDWRPQAGGAKRIDKDGESLEKEYFNSTGIAVENLRSQLGLSSSRSRLGPFVSDFLTSFPLLKGVFQRPFWGNRNSFRAIFFVRFRRKEYPLNVLRPYFCAYCPFRLSNTRRESLQKTLSCIL